MMPLANLSGAIWEPPSLFEPRTFELLGLIATLHIRLAAWLTRQWTLGGVCGLIGQVLVFTFCYHARSSLGWVAVFVILLNAAAIGFSLTRGFAERTQRESRWLSAVPLTVFLCGFLSLTFYEHVAYNPRYFKDKGTRTFWHNALMGVGSNAALAAKYKLGIGDDAVIRAVIADMRANHDPRLTDQWTNENILNSLGGWADFDWFEYESAARTLYFDIWKRDFGEMVHCYVVDKPLAIASLITSSWREDRDATRALHDVYFRPMGPVSQLIAIPAVLLLMRNPWKGLVLLALTLLLICSLIPGLLFYSVVLTMMGTFATLTMVLYVLSATVLNRLVSALGAP